MIHAKVYELKFLAPLSKLTLHIARMGFIDDTDMIQTGLQLDDYLGVAAKLKEARILWKRV